jgi:tetratricopeptide (TPR) repeat protein
MDSRLYQKVLTLFFCLGCVTAVYPQSPQQWRDSLAVLNRLISQHPESTDLRLRKAAVNIELQQWDYAVEEYGTVLRLDAGNPAALYYRGYAYTHMRHYALARQDYESLLQRVPRHFEAHLALAHVLQKLDRRTDALDELNRIVEMFPDSAHAYVARALYEQQYEQYDVALYDWDEAIRLNPRDVSLVASKAELLLMLKRKDEARRTLDDAVRRGIPRYALKEWYDKII